MNIGVSTNKLLAKMGGELKKPDMVHNLFPEEIPVKMWPLVIEELYFVGRATSKKLRARGIRTIGELANCDPKLLVGLKSHGRLIWNYANGIENSPVKPGGNVPFKGLGNSTTLPFDVGDLNTVYLVLLSLVETVSARLRQDHVRARLISTSFRTSEFLSYSHQRKIKDSTDCTDEIWEITKELFGEIWQGQPIRHMGVGVSELCTDDFTQLTIFMKSYEKNRKINQTINPIRERFGAKAMIRSSYLNSGLSPMTGGAPEEDYPMMSSIL